MKEMLETLFSRKKRKEREFYMNRNPRYRRYEIGDYTYGDPKVVSFHEGSTLRMGKFCSLSKNVTIFLGGEHRTDWVTTYPFSALFEEAAHIKGHPATKGDVIVGNDVWIGFGVTILSGVTIGDGAAIAARSVVTSSVKPYEIVGGNPAKHIKFRFNEETIAKLLEIRWWDWDLDTIKANVDLLLQPDVNRLLAPRG